MLAKEGYQCVYPCPDPVFPPPGIHQPRHNVLQGGAVRKHIPFQCMNDPYYISTRTDLSDVNGGLLTRSNKYIWKLGESGSLLDGGVRQTKNCVVGQEDLADSKFPRNYISSEVKVGKLKHSLS